MRPGSTPKYWTPEEHAKLRRLVEEWGTDKWDEIAAELGRTKSAVITRYRDYREGGGYRENWRTIKAATAAATALRAARLEPTSLTAALLGDPLPGRSALDQRQARPEIRSISLAGGAR